MKRPRRLRTTEGMRALVRENSLRKEDFIYPVFVRSGNNIKEEISSMPGIYRYSIDRVEEEIKEVIECGLHSILLFGVPEKKDDMASEAYNSHGLVQQAIRLIKDKYPSLVVMTDVCVCSYTPHGHCGIVHDNYVQNDASLEILSKMAVSHAKAGADVVAPSAMLDGQINALRVALDDEGLYETSVMAYSAKYYSSCYGPFREAADSTPQFGDRASYQMDTANSKEAMREIKLDIEEGADIIMIKPAIFYLDIISKAFMLTDLPIAAYNVSGEYSMIKAAALKGWIDEKKVMMEMLLSMKRAGASLIISYFAKDASRYL